MFDSKCTVFKTVPFPELFPPGLNLALKGPVMAMRRASGSILRARGFFRQFRRRQTELLFSGSSTAFDVNLESIFKQSPFAGIVLFFGFYAHAASAVDMMCLLEFFQLQSGEVLASFCISWSIFSICRMASARICSLCRGDLDNFRLRLMDLIISIGGNQLDING